MNISLLTSPEAVGMLRFLQLHDRKVRVDDFGAAFPNADHWIDALKEAKFIDVDDFRMIDMQFTYTTYILTPLGSTALAEFERQRQHDSDEHAEKEKARSQSVEDQRKQRRHDYLVAAFSAIFGVLLTLLVEHFNQLVAFIVNLVRQAFSS